MLTTLLFGLIAALAEVLGGAFVILRRVWPKKIQEVLIALSAGFLLALAFFELIPASISILGAAASIYLLLGFALLHFFEHTLVGHLHFGEETHSEVMVSKLTGFSTFFGLLIHAFFDGFSISAGMSHDFFLGVLVFLAVLLHKFPEGLTIASVMIASKQTRGTALLASGALGAATLLGVCTVFPLSTVDKPVVGIALALSGGISTYVGASDLIPEINKSGSRISPVFVLAGMVLFYLCGWLLEAVMMK
jgi:ZIP family zinc transporter/zinc and cadmium transporter